MTHWADVEAATLMERHGDNKQLFATAITPSGPIHVGNMREVLTSEAIFRATVEAGGDAEFLYIADDYDPLRKVYPFLEIDAPGTQNTAGIDYAQYVGRPLREIPCPCGDHGDYAEHFLGPFLGALEDLGVRPTVKSAYQMYHDGDFVDATQKVLDKAEELRTIIETISKRQLPKRWAPFNPQCSQCKMIHGVEVTGYDAPTLSYTCACGHEGTHDVREPGIGKLPWRIDWPARWAFLGVTFEASGKDHHAAGGSWQTGLAICEQIFEATPPYGIMYEFLNLKGKGAMHSSTGLAISATDVLSMTPPEVLRYLLVRQSPRKHIDFDPGLGVLNLVDEFDRLERIRYGAEENPGTFTEVERTYDLSCPEGAAAAMPLKVAYRHLVTVVQMVEDPTSPAGVDAVAAILRRSGELSGDLDAAGRAGLADRVHHVVHWIDNFAPENIRFQVQPELPDYPFDADERSFLAEAADALSALGDDDWTGIEIHDAVYEAKGERKPGAAFKAIYQAILGQDRGPRAGFFLASQDRAFVIGRLREAAGDTEAAEQAA